MAQAPAPHTASPAVLRVTTDAASLAGIFAGDQVLIDTTAEPRNGDLVAVRLDTGDAACFRVHGPFLMPQSHRHLPALPIAGADVLGTVRQLWRDM
ncbi:MAG: hypothetical protein K2X74_08840 [Acetobacteraceae bacterium]|nr:hypothetical protein [Acetobacteraceae bacterium]